MQEVDGKPVLMTKHVPLHENQLLMFNTNPAVLFKISKLVSGIHLCCRLTPVCPPDSWTQGQDSEEGKDTEEPSEAAIWLSDY